MATATLRDEFIAGQARIAYREWSYRGGNVIAWTQRDEFGDVQWFNRHETETDDQAHSEVMSEARARHIFPTDAVLVEA